MLCVADGWSQMLSTRVFHPSLWNFQNITKLDERIHEKVFRRPIGNKIYPKFKSLLNSFQRSPDGDVQKVPPKVIHHQTLEQMCLWCFLGARIAFGGVELARLIYSAHCSGGRTELNIARIAMFVISVSNVSNCHQKLS